MARRVVTVLGEADPDSLGFVLPHEHILIDTRKDAHEEPQELGEKEKFRRRVAIENLGHVLYHPFHYKDNLDLSDVQIAIEEVREFKYAGGGTIVDLTLGQMGRDPSALHRVSLATGIEIVMGSGKFAQNFWSAEEKEMSIEELEREIISEFSDGVSTMKIRPGIIGEIGVSDIHNPYEIKNLRASGRAQNRIGCAINIHCPIWEKEGNAIIDILVEEGANPDKIVLSHMDETIDDVDYHDSLVKRGAYVEYDQFGMHMMSSEGVFLPSDNERIKAVVEQVRRGNLKRLLISQDTFTKIQLKRWGGFGYSHILENIVPRLKQVGLSEEQVHMLLIDNPKEALSW